MRHFPPRATMPKRKHPDDVPPMSYIWSSRHDDPRWQAWMQDGVWSKADLSTLLKAQKVPAKLPLPYFPGDRSDLSARAAEKFDAAVALFDKLMSETQDAPHISDLLDAANKVKHDLNTKEGEFRLYLTDHNCYGAVSTKSGRPLKLTFEPVFRHIDESKFVPLVDFHLTNDAFRAFRAHVTQYPGCDAKKVELTYEQKKARGEENRKHASSTLVAISFEAVRAFQNKTVWPMSADMMHAVGFFDDRVATEGKPIQQRGGGVRGRYIAEVDYRLAPWRVPSLRRPNWRFREDDVFYGDPDDELTQLTDAQIAKARRIGRP